MSNAGVTTNRAPSREARSTAAIARAAFERDGTDGRVQLGEGDLHETTEQRGATRGFQTNPADKKGEVRPHDRLGSDGEGLLECPELANPD